MPSPAKAEEPLPKAAQVPPKPSTLPNGFKRARHHFAGQGEERRAVRASGRPFFEAFARPGKPSSTPSTAFWKRHLSSPGSKQRLIGSPPQLHVPNNPSYPRSDSPSSSKAFRPKLNLQTDLQSGRKHSAGYPDRLQAGRGSRAFASQAV